MEYDHIKSSRLLWICPAIGMSLLKTETVCPPSFFPHFIFSQPTSSKQKRQRKYKGGSETHETTTAAKSACKGTIANVINTQRRDKREGGKGWKGRRDKSSPCLNERRLTMGVRACQGVRERKRSQRWGHLSRGRKRQKEGKSRDKKREKEKGQWIRGIQCVRGYLGRPAAN